MTDFAVARKNMVESQVRPSGISARALLSAMDSIPREIFIPTAHKPLAYMDGDVDLRPDSDRFIMEARVFAKLVQLAEIGTEDLVLDIGAGTGYSTAVLANLADAVVGLEIDAAFVSAATDNLVLLDIDNAAVVSGALEEGCVKQGPYDVIVLEGSVEEVPETLFDQLKAGGRLVAIVETETVGKGRLFRKSENGTISHRDAFDASIKSLPGFRTDRSFVF